MKLPLKYFLLLSLLLGAVAIPLGYKYFKSRREAEIETLTKELEALWANEPSVWQEGGLRVSSGPIYDPRKLEAHTQRVRAIEARLEKLTGKKPKMPSNFKFPEVWEEIQ